MHPYRTRFKKEIVAEFLPPAKYYPKKPQKVVILCDGAPMVPKNRVLLEFFSKKGYWVFYPRYRGAWESGGTFLKYPLEKDVLDIVDELSKGFKALAAVKSEPSKAWKLVPAAIFVIGGSFGGPAALFASLDPRITKVVVVSPVVEWRAESKAEPLDWLMHFFHDAFGNGYRFGRKEWAKLKNGKFYNPLPRAREFDGKKILIYHNKDDESVGWKEVSQFAKLTKAKIILKKKGGHGGAGKFTHPAEWKRLSRFLNS